MVARGDSSSSNIDPMELMVVSKNVKQINLAQNRPIKTHNQLIKTRNRPDLLQTGL